MDKVRKKQIIFLSINIFILLTVFVALFVYDNFIREPFIVYRRPLVPMKKVYTGGDPLFKNYDKMDLFSQYKGTRAVGSDSPEKMVLLIAHPSYEQNFHFSHLLYEAYKLKYGLVVVDFKDIRHFVPIEDESGQVLSKDERYKRFIEVMISYMRQYGFTRFRIAYLGVTPDKTVLDSFSSLVYPVPGAEKPLKEVLSMEEEVRIIRDIFDF